MAQWSPQYVVTDREGKKAIVSFPEVKEGRNLTSTVLQTSAEGNGMEVISRNCKVAPDGSVLVDVGSILAQSSSETCNLQVRRAVSSQRRRRGRNGSRHRGGITHPTSHNHADTTIEDDTPAASLGPQAEAPEQMNGFISIPYHQIPMHSSIMASGATSLSDFREGALLDAGIERCLDGFHLLRSNARNEIRGTHVLTGKRESGLVSVRALAEDGGMANYVGFIWQYSTSPPKSVCVTMSLSDHTSNDGALIARCSCSPYSQDQCVHIAACCKNEAFMSLVSSTLQDTNNQNNFFGTAVTAESGTALANLNRKLPTKSKSSKRKKQSLRRSWSFWISFDKERCLFVPILKRFKLAFQCQLCRGSSAIRGTCAHEFHTRKIAIRINMYDVVGDGGVENAEITEDNAASRSGRGPSCSDADKFLHCPTHVSFPVLPCKGILRMMDTLNYRIENLQHGKKLELVDSSFQCIHCKNDLPPSQVTTSKRTGATDVLTLEKGFVSVHMFDWVCPMCSRKNYYTGRSDAVFPVRSKVAYGLDYLYCLVDLVCRLGMSQRVAYESLCVVGRASRKLLQFQVGRKLASELVGGTVGAFLQQRRRVTEALGMFMSTLTIGKDTGQEELFKCTTCEVDLTKEDRNTLGLSEEEARGRKRYCGIVVDGTSCGILNGLPGMNRERVCSKIPAPKGTGRKFMVTKNTEKAVLKSLSKLASDHLKWVTKDVRNNRRWFWVQPKNGGVERRGMLFLRTLFRVAPCTCSASSNNQNATSRAHDFLHDENCTYNRFRKNRALSSLSETLQCMYRLELRSSTGLIHRTESDIDEISEEDSFDGDIPHTTMPLPQSHATPSHAANTFISSVPANAQQSGATLLPNNAHTPAVSHPPTSRSGRRHSSVQGSPQNGQNGSNQSHRNDLKWSMSLRVDNPRDFGQLIQRSLILFDFYARGHLLLTYLTPTPTVAAEIGNGSDTNAQFLEPGRPNYRRKALMKSSKKIHCDMLQALESLLSCDHSGEEIEHGPPDRLVSVCNDCTNAVFACADRLEPTNPILSSFCMELAECARITPDFPKVLVAPVVNLVRDHMELAERLCERLDAIVLHPSGKVWRDYYDKFDSINLGPLQEDEQNIISHETGIVFPGMMQYRDYVVFEKGEQFDCGKRYAKSKRFSPGILTVQCCCTKPQVLGYIVMKKAESTALALSAALCCFQIPPRIVYYDNGCNLLASMITRFPALTHQTKISIDRFHVKGHTCPPIHNPDSYRHSDYDKTTTAESINARIEKSVPFIRYLKEENLIPFLNIRFSLLNISTRCRRERNKTDMEDVDLWSFFRSTVPCPCQTCKGDAQQAIVLRNREHYGIEPDDVVEQIDLDTVQVEQPSHVGDVDAIQISESDTDSDRSSAGISGDSDSVVSSG